MADRAAWSGAPAPVLSVSGCRRVRAERRQGGAPDGRGDAAGEGMSSVPVVTPADLPAMRAAARARPRRWLRTVAFAGLCAYSVERWGRAVGPSVAGGVCTAWRHSRSASPSSSRSPDASPRASAITAGCGGALTGAVLTVAMIVAALAIAGLRVAWIWHVRIAVSIRAIGHGLNAMGTILVPYLGHAYPVRLVVTLGAAVLLLDAGAALAFAGNPNGELGDGRRAAAALPLVALAIVPSTLVPARAPAIQGLILFGLLALFVWGERVVVGRRGAALGLACAAGLVGLIGVPALSSSRPWVNYQAWGDLSTGGAGLRASTGTRPTARSAGLSMAGSCSPSVRRPATTGRRRTSPCSTARPGSRGRSPAERVRVACSRSPTSCSPLQRSRRRRRPVALAECRRGPALQPHGSGEDREHEYVRRDRRLRGHAATAARRRRGRELRARDLEGVPSARPRRHLLGDDLLADALRRPAAERQRAGLSVGRPRLRPVAHPARAGGARAPSSRSPGSISHSAACGRPRSNSSPYASGGHPRAPPGRRSRATPYAFVRAVQHYLDDGRYLYDQRPADRALSAARLPVPLAGRLLPAVLRRDGDAAADGRRAGARRGRLHPGQPRRQAPPVDGERHRRPRLGRGVVPDLRLGALRPDPVDRTRPARLRPLRRAPPGAINNAPFDVGHSAQPITRERAATTTTSPHRHSPPAPAAARIGGGSGGGGWGWIAGGIAARAAARRRPVDPHPPRLRSTGCGELERALARTGRPLPGGATLASLEHALPRLARRRRLRARAAPGALRAARPAPPTSSGRRAVRAELAAGLGLAGRLRALWALPPRPRRGRGAASPDPALVAEPRTPRDLHDGRGNRRRLRPVPARNRAPRRGAQPSGGDPARPRARSRADKTSIREALGRALFGAQRYEQAAAEFQAVVDRAPTNDFALFCLGRSLQLLGRHAEARRPLALAACLQPGRRDYREYRDRARARAAQAPARLTRAPVRRSEAQAAPSSPRAPTARRRPGARLNAQLSRPDRPGAVPKVGARPLFLLRRRRRT